MATMIRAFDGSFVNSSSFLAQVGAHRESRRAVLGGALETV
jgi:hypothetical protein